MCCDGVNAKIGWHFCFGNAWGNDILSANYPEGYQTVLPHLFGTAGIDEFVLDYANRDMAGIEFLKNLPANQGIQCGVLDIRTNAIESPAKIAERIRKVVQGRARRQGHAQHRLRHEAAGSHGREDEAQCADRGRGDRPQGSRGTCVELSRYERRRRSASDRDTKEGRHGKDHCSSGCNRRAGRRSRPRDPGRSEQRVLRACDYARHRARTRQRRSAAAGAEVVSADLDNVESLKKAFAGAHGVYAVTNFWEHFSGEKEIAQAKNIAEAAKAAGVKHVIWSTLEDTRKLMSADDTRMPMLQGKYRVPHFDAKAEADAAFAGLPVTYPGDLVLLGQPLHVRSGAEEGRRGRLQLDVPDGRRQAGRHRRRGHRQGRLRHLQGRRAVHRQDRRHRRREPQLPGDEREAAKGLGISPVQFNAVDANLFRSFGFPGADEYGNMFQVYRDFEKQVNAARSIETTREAQSGRSQTLRSVAGEEQGRGRRSRESGAGQHTGERVRSVRGVRLLVGPVLSDRPFPFSPYNLRHDSISRSGGSDEQTALRCR